MVGDVLQPTHLIFILVVALLVLGPKRLPEVGRSLGKGIRDFRGALTGIDEPMSTSTEAESRPSEVPPVTPATTSLPAETQMQDDSHVVPVDWPTAEPDTEDESHAGPDQAVPGSDEAKDAASADVPVAPVANPFRQD